MISVVIPTYNRAGFLEQAIESVMVQSMPAMEIIIVDDGSTDDTHSLVMALRQKSAVPIRYLYQENEGAAAARNAGIRECRQQYIAFLDSDDRWLPRKLERQFAAMVNNPEYPVSHTREIWYRRGKRVNQRKKHDPPHGYIFEQSLKMCVVGMSTVMIDREAFNRFGLFNEELPCCEDYDLWLRMSCKVPFYRLEEQLICKDGGREDQLSALHRLGMDVYRINSICNLLAGDQLNTTQTVQAFAELERKCLIYGNGCLKHGRPEEGRKYLNLPEKIQLECNKNL